MILLVGTSDDSVVDTKKYENLLNINYLEKSLRVCNGNYYIYDGTSGCFVSNEAGTQCIIHDSCKSLECKDNRMIGHFRTG
jgi:hypothetical protein